ncbi:putative PEP-binding protein [Streptosporangium sp. CA-135522]|uniref:putative PEP-binding protein n=1 Tax=Streptosporangium sp. CA-135522 TaxID=3240072 RepID=UPI003D8E9CE7
MSSFTGSVASPGVALGFARRTDRPRPASTGERAGGEPARRVTEAFDAVAERLSDLAATLRERGRPEQADIMEVNGHIARDGDLRAAAIQRADEGVPVADAIREAVGHYATMIASLGDPTLAERAADVRQVGKRALAWLDGADLSGGAGTDGPLVLIAEEIGAADLLETESPIAAALSVTGGPNSHAAIVARSLSIPLLTGIDRALLDMADGVELLVDGGRGTVRPHPPTPDREAALAEMARARDRRVTYAAERDLPCQTLDGHPVVLRANIATAEEARAALASGADGVGLLRTELPFLEATSWPTQALHSVELSPIMRELVGRTVTVRTLDFADDKLPPFLTAGRQGQRLGRGLPLMLAEPAAFADQFRAVLSVAPAGDGLRLMIPMVADIAEFRACRDLLDAAATELGVPAPPLGVMIELPEAVAAADRLAAEAAFLSIGSNDLTSQILGLDRRDPAATPMMTAHPRVLAAIAEVVRAAHRHGRQVSICGDAAANATVMPLLVGLGCDVLSVSPAALDEIRYRIRRLRRDDCRNLAADALRCDSAEQVWDLVQQSSSVLPA